MTPRELEDELLTSVPEAAESVGLITGAYEDARYGDAEIDDRTLAVAGEAVNSLNHNQPGPAPPTLKDEREHDHPTRTGRVILLRGLPNFRPRVHGSRTIVPGASTIESARSSVQAAPRHIPHWYLLLDGDPADPLL